jgi:hypothetical protein
LTFIGIWQPQTDKEVLEVRHTVGLYNVEGVVEVWDQDQLEALLERLGATLVCLEQDTHAVPLGMFLHPFNAFYLVGPINGTIPKNILDLGRIVQVETPSRYPLRPSVAAAIVLHDNYIEAGGTASQQKETA